MPVFKDPTGKRWKVQEGIGLEGLLIRNYYKSKLTRWYFQHLTDYGVGNSYLIKHNSLRVQINGEAAFYTSADSKYLDHSPQLLGFEVHGSITRGTSGEVRVVTDAKGIEGFLYQSIGNLHFRIYVQNVEQFTDYPIHHSDLQVIILGEAALYQSGDKHYLDYLPRTLGYKLIGED